MFLISTDFFPTLFTKLIKMAATHKSHIAIERMKLSEVCVPWCDEFERMICGMK